MMSLGSEIPEELYKYGPWFLLAFLTHVFIVLMCYKKSGLTDSQQKTLYPGVKCPPLRGTGDTFLQRGNSVPGDKAERVEIKIY